ncbi:ArgS-related anticodon-binding protein NrtL [Streptomyces roseoverticillatus]|uniref:ArgS-related anticodon-binding protein NrtL n=1 Tax=Streptomyces roseoverticillatus TaxID=66429 RepID=UPI0004BFA2A5|nr:DALR anticodon-binding domain-containing protein [Streptomyces roseoverticillatus]
MTPAELSRTVLRTVQCAVEADELPAAVPTRVTVRVPPRPGCGDFATNVALRVAQDTGRPAREVAEVLRKRLAAEPGIARVEIAGPGFLNITLEGISYVQLVRELLSAPPAAAPLPLPVPDPALLARLGSDAARWSLLWPAGAGRAELLVQRERNPLFRVRYAHARTQGLLRNARDLGFRSEVAEPAEYGHTAAAPLLAALADHPRVTAARDPERLARHLDRTAGAFLTWQAARSVLPRGDEKPSAVHRARLALAEAAGNVLADGLHQLGITAPAHL